MPEPGRCPQCGTNLPPDAPPGICPKCMLGLGFHSASDQPADLAATAPPTPPGRFVAPQPAELAAHFPQLEILELLGQGGMGAVYKARQRQLNRLVALKILPPEVGRDPAFAERFQREAQALAQLNHPQIVMVHDSGQANGLYFFLMEYVDGLNLRRMLAEGRLSPPEALAIVPQICDALQYAHDEGVVHRDIKPENILLDRKGRVKIADFGLARLVGQSRHDFTLTGTQQVMGTPHYMAPEQMERPQTVDHRADIYSLGVVFYEMLTGELPLGRFQPPSKKVQVDVRLDEVVLRSLEKEPELRYQQASSVKTDVEAISRPVPLKSRPDEGVRTAFPRVADSMPAEPAETRLRSAGIWMTIAAAISLLFWIGTVGASLISLLAVLERGDDIDVHPTMAAILLALHPVPVIVAALHLLAAVKTWTRRSRGWTITAATFSCIPYSPAWIIGMPAAIFALMQLRKPAAQPFVPARTAQAQNPFAARTFDAGDNDQLEAVRDQVRIPAIGLIVLGAIQCAVFGLVMILGIILAGFWFMRVAPPRAVRGPAEYHFKSLPADNLTRPLEETMQLDPPLPSDFPPVEPPRTEPPGSPTPPGD